VWYQKNNLSHNVSKTKEKIVNYRKSHIHIDGAVVERDESSKFLGVLKLSWSKHTKKVMKRARQCLFPLAGPIWHGSLDPQKVLQLQHQERPDRLHHRLEWQLLDI
jgi:hypothetical protein